MPNTSNRDSTNVPPPLVGNYDESYAFVLAAGVVPGPRKSSRSMSPL